MLEKDTIKRLTLEQVERLTESLLDGCCRQNEVVDPLLIILNDLYKNCRDATQVEQETFAAMRRCYAGTCDADDAEALYLQRIRKQWESFEEMRGTALEQQPIP